MKSLYFVAVLLTAAVARGADLEAAALEYLSGRDQNVYFVLDDGVKRVNVSHITMSDVRASTNHPAVLALAGVTPPPPVPISTTYYESDWAVTILPDGQEIKWRWRNSPYDPAVDEANWQAALAENAIITASARTARNAATNDVARANTVPALRAIVIEQQMQINALMRRAGMLE